MTDAGMNHAMKMMREQQDARVYNEIRAQKWITIVVNVLFLVFLVWYVADSWETEKRRHNQLINAITPTTQLRSDLEGHAHFPRLPVHTHPEPLDTIPRSFGTPPDMDTGTTGQSAVIDIMALNALLQWGAADTLKRHMTMFHPDDTIDVPHWKILMDSLLHDSAYIHFRDSSLQAHFDAIWDLTPDEFFELQGLHPDTAALPDSIFPFSPEFKKLIDSANIGWRKSEVNNIEFGLRIPKDAAIDTRMVDSMLERWFNSLGYSMYPPEPPINSEPARVD